ncbi:MAG: tRNA (adenosine(37)-N6)-dimethylallyltransferase MiaA [Bifidobacteriaceae bacterium]|jgi:tRNA dimethylallyltransferase|nr:tRNA (adenosine(37)-N6)-dimethylallyltransferase MiaA [Bifidobacteriaceae bacterium]
MDAVVIAIVGPTATGKSDLALDLAERLGGEIVGADAMQLYRGMDIGTAKVPPGERRGIAHHQIDVLDVREEASVAAYQRHGRADIAEIAGRGRPVVGVGGSGLYVRSLLDRIEFPGTDPAARAAWEARAADAAPGELHALLAERDPAAAAAIGPGNTRRIVRALEVIDLTGRPFSANLPRYEYAVPALQIGLDGDTEVIDQAIEARVERMIADGLIAEVETLARAGLREGRTACRATGYAEALAVLDGRASLAEARATIVQATRQLARRQRKWFRRDTRIRWVEAGAGARAGALDLVGDMGEPWVPDRR